MNLITINVDFKHDGQQYYAGELRKITPELCGYFCAAGWAGDSPVPKIPTDPVTLSVQNVKHGLKANSPGSK